MAAAQNHIFSVPEIRLLTDSSRWQIMAPHLEPEVKPHHYPEYAKWYRTHKDKHPHREILFALSGRSIRTFGGKTYPVTPGTVILYEKMDPHDLDYPANHASARHLIIFFFQDYINFSLLCVGAASRRTSCVPLWSWGCHIIDMGLVSSDALYLAPNSSAPGNVVRQCCVNALLLVTSSVASRTYELDNQLPSFREDVIQAMCRYIEENHGRGCRLETIARLAGYSKYHFSRIFEKHAHVSLGAFVNDVKIRSFKKMVAQGMQYRTIAKELGFGNASGLCRWRRQNRL